MPSPILLAVSHGTGSSEGQAAIAGLRKAVQARLGKRRWLAGARVDVRLAHVDVQQPDVDAAVSALAGQRVVLVPLLLSAGYHVRVDLTRATKNHPRATVSTALGPDRRLVTVLAARLAEVALTANDAVVLAVAGSSDERANEDCRETARLLAARLGQPVQIGFLAATEPRLDAAIEAAAHATSGRVIVSSYLLAPGYFHNLAAKTLAHSGAANRGVLTPPLLTAEDAPVQLVELVIERYLGAVR